MAISGAGTKVLGAREPAAASASNLPAHALDPDYWCKTIDTTNPDAIHDIWETKGVGNWLGIWTQPSDDKDELGPDDWPYHIFKAILPNVGNPDIGGCGVVGGGCSPSLNCTDMVLNGGGSGGEAYWALQALIGMQDKLNVAHEFLQDATIDNILLLSQIADDFTAPDNIAALAELAGLLSSCFYMVGSLAGSAGVAISTSLTKMEGAAARVGSAQAKVAKITRGGFSYPKAALTKAQDELTAAQKALKSVTDTTEWRNTVGPRAGAMGSASYLVGSTFGLISAGAGVGDDYAGQVDAGDLAPTLQALFDSARQSLQTIGNLAAGGGGDYDTLPHQNGTGGVQLNSNMYIAGFYSDGKMLLGESSPAFNETVQAAFDMFTPKIVDQALQTAGYTVLALTQFKDADSCTKSQSGLTHYGYQWVKPDGTDGYCMSLWRDNPGGTGPCPGDASSCNMVPADQTHIDKIQSKYGINIYDYYMASYKCTMAGLAGDIPDFVNLPTDGSLPTCWFSIVAQKATLGFDCGGSSCNTANRKYKVSTSSFK